MYRLSRLLLIIGCLAVWVAVGALILLAWPFSMLFALAIVTRWKRKRRALTTLGSARWANRQELQAAGMLDADSGLILGRLETDGQET